VSAASAAVRQNHYRQLCFLAVAPRYGKLFCLFSMLWKIFFHSVENLALPILSMPLEN
jgi:hypothetical protein